MTLGYVLMLCLKICATNIKVQKIDSFILKTFEIVLASFEIKDKLEKARFLFLLADFNIKIVLKMLFFIFSNTIIKII